MSKVLGWRHTAEELETPRGQEIIQNVSDQLSSRATAIVQLLPQLPEQVSRFRNDLLHHTQPVQPPKLHRLHFIGSDTHQAALKKLATLCFNSISALFHCMQALCSRWSLAASFLSVIRMCTMATRRSVCFPVGCNFRKTTVTQTLFCLLQNMQWCFGICRSFEFFDTNLCRRQQKTWKISCCGRFPCSPPRSLASAATS